LGKRRSNYENIGVKNKLCLKILIRYRTGWVKNVAQITDEYDRGDCNMAVGSVGNKPRLD
jgi:hypothetical protein